MASSSPRQGAPPPEAGRVTDTIDDDAEFESSVEDENETEQRTGARTVNVQIKESEHQNVAEEEDGSDPSAPTGQACMQIGQEDDLEHHERESKIKAH